MSADKKNITTDGDRDVRRLLAIIENNELDRRIERLEHGLENVRDEKLTRHTQTMTWILTGIGIIVTLFAIGVGFLAIFSHGEIKDAIADMNTRFDKQETKMRDDFSKLAGDALKKPVLSLETKDGLLDGKEFTFGRGPVSLPFYPLLIKNIGDKKSDSLSMRLYVSSPLSWADFDDYWQTVTSDDKDYPFCLSYYHPISGIFPKDFFTLEHTGISFYASTNVYNFKLDVFYGGENPAVSKFSMKMK